MSAVVTEFINIITLFWTFVKTYLVPTGVSDVNIIHVAIWTPVMLGLLTMTTTTIKRLWGGSSRSRK